MNQRGQIFTLQDDGLVLAVKAVLKSRRDAVVGVMATPEGHALKVAVTAAPENGKANAAVAAVVAKALNVPKSAVSVVSGARALPSAADVPRWIRRPRLKCFEHVRTGKPSNTFPGRAHDRRKFLRVAGDPAALSHRAQQWIKS